MPALREDLGGQAGDLVIARLVGEVEAANRLVGFGSPFAVVGPLEGESPEGGPARSNPSAADRQKARQAAHHREAGLGDRADERLAGVVVARPDQPSGLGEARPDVGLARGEGRVAREVASIDDAEFRPQRLALVLALEVVDVGGARSD